MVLGEFKKKVMEEIKIGVVGLGYVGLPLARIAPLRSQTGREGVVLFL